MPDFKDREELEAWLEGRPKAVSVMIAARAALRVLPLQAVGFRRGNRDAVAGDVVLRVFRAVAEPWVAVKYSVDFLKVAAAFTLEPGHYEYKGGDLTAGHAVGTARGHSTATGIGGSIVSATGTASGRTIFASAGSVIGSARADAANAAHAAHAASKAADGATAARAAADAVVHAADAVVHAAEAAAAAVAAAAAMWGSISADAKRIDNGMGPEKLAGEPLWTDKTPDWFHPGLPR